MADRCPKAPRSLVGLAASAAVLLYACLSSLSPCSRACWLLWGLYLPSYFTPDERHASRYWPWLAEHPAWRRLFGYFPARVVVTAPLDNDAQHIIASHPHGVMSLHHAMYASNGCGFHKHSPGHRRHMTAASVLFWIPLVRELALWLGAVDASRAVLSRCLRRGQSLSILVGGEHEQLLAEPSAQKAYARSRLGFVKLALQHGASIVPAYCFGEHETYSTSSWGLGARLWLVRTLGVAVPLAWGRGWLPVMPKRVPLTTVVGAPIRVQRCPEPTREQVRAVWWAEAAGARGA